MPRTLEQRERHASGEVVVESTAQVFALPPPYWYGTIEEPDRP